MALPVMPLAPVINATFPMMYLDKRLSITRCEDPGLSSVFMPWLTAKLSAPFASKKRLGVGLKGVVTQAAT